VSVCVHACVRACMRACMRACVHACVRVDRPSLGPVIAVCSNLQFSVLQQSSIVLQRRIIRLYTHRQTSALYTDKQLPSLHYIKAIYSGLLGKKL